MILKEAARNIAEKAVAANWNRMDDDFEIIEDNSGLTPAAWIFPCTSKRYLETGAMQKALGGKAPLFVSRADGKVSRYPAESSLECMIDAFEVERKVWFLKVRPDRYDDLKKLINLKSRMHWSREQLKATKNGRNDCLSAPAYRSRFARQSSSVCVQSSNFTGQ